jgi:hypothetical protein
MRRSVTSLVRTWLSTMLRRWSLLSVIAKGLERAIAADISQPPAGRPAPIVDQVL